MYCVRLLAILVVLGCSPACAQTLFHMAENQVPVALIRIIQGPQHTEVHLQTQAPTPGVCWASIGPDMPYLLSANRRYRFLGGEPITECPHEKDYKARDIMVLRFEPLGAQTCEFSLVEGEGGEKQMTGRESLLRRYWNFLRVKLCASISVRAMNTAPG